MCYRPALFVALIALAATRPTADARGADAPGPADARALFDSGQSLFKEGRYAQAAETFEQALRRGLNDHHVYNWLGDTYLKLTDFDRAIAAYSALIRLGEEETCAVCMEKAYGGRAAAHMAKGDYPQAVADYDEVVLRCLETLRDYPDDADFKRAAARAYRDRSQALQARGHVATARLDADRAARLEGEAERPPLRSALPHASLKPSGTLRLLNRWATPVTVLVDGVPYRLRPGGRPTDVTHEPGPFRYEVLGVQAPLTRTLEIGRVFTIEVGPR